MGIPLLYPWANRLARFGYRGRRQARDAVRGRLADPARRQRAPDPRGPPGAAALGCRGLRRRPMRSSRRLRLATPTSCSSCSRSRTRFGARRASAAAELTLTTTVTASTDGPVPVSFGYHPYTRVPGAGATTGWSRSAPPTGSCSTTARSRPASASPVDREPFRLGGVEPRRRLRRADPAPAAFDAPAPATRAHGGVSRRLLVRAGVRSAPGRSSSASNR